VKIRGAWTYLYRAVDREGQTVDFRLTTNRDVKAAKAFFRKALATQGRAPVSITLDGYAASHRAVRRNALARSFGRAENSHQSRSAHPPTRPTWRHIWFGEPMSGFAAPSPRR
jgi:putative transposase